MSDVPPPDEHIALILEQLEYLGKEVAVLRKVISRVPPELLAERPYDGALSVLELYALLASADEKVHLEALRHAADGTGRDVPVLSRDVLLKAAAAPGTSIETVLESVTNARSRLVAYLRSREPSFWAREVLVDGASHRVDAYCMAIVHHDTNTQREISERFHDSRLFR